MLVSILFGNSHIIFTHIHEYGTKTTADNSIRLNRLSRISDNYNTSTGAQVQYKKQHTYTRTEN